LDESSWACRSAYGRALIFYNPMKNTGKYHFRFYCLCDGTTYSVLRFKIHTHNNSDTGDGLNANLTNFLEEGETAADTAVDDDEVEEERTVLCKLVLDMY